MPLVVAIFVKRLRLFIVIVTFLVVDAHKRLAIQPVHLKQADDAVIEASDQV